MAQDASATSIATHTSPGYAAYRAGAAGEVHNEAAFRYFLAIERRRAEQAGRSVVLVLVSLRSTPGRNQQLPARAASAIFLALGGAVREVDFVGWFRDGRVAAAALIQRGRPQPDAIAARIANLLREEFRGAEADLRLRFVSLGAPSKSP